jgi:hypothetical protein
MRFRLSTRALAWTICLSVIAMVASQPVRAASPLTLKFVTHASFFSEETHQPKALDPHAFVKDPNAPAATGPQNIEHAAGYRPALLNDAASTPVFTAAGKPLGFTFGRWLGAKGTVTITPLASGGARITAHFTGLRPNGVYSLFENHFDQQPVGFTPLDGTGKKNSFRAKPDGTARIAVAAPQMLTHANAVLLVYHSDRTSHGSSRGEIGINAHHQLIARLP